MHPLLEKTDHRPFPVPSNPWVMSQTWAKLLFAHWPVNAAEIRDLVPDCLELDLYDGHAWIGIVPFVMNDVRPRFTKTTGWISNFLELNVRTYVKKKDVSGVYFFSLDCSNPIAVAVARRFYHLPYYVAKMSFEHRSNGVIHYTSERARGKAALIMSYQPNGERFSSESGSIERFLTERYCLFTVDQKKRLHQGVIHHELWPLQPAEAEFELNSMTLPLNIELPNSKPLLHYSERLDTLEWPLSLVSL